MEPHIGNLFYSRYSELVFISNPGRSFTTKYIELLDIFPFNPEEIPELAFSTSEFTRIRMEDTSNSNDDFCSPKALHKSMTEMLESSEKIVKSVTNV